MNIKEQEKVFDMANSYNELMAAVETKHEGETRHQTALRYIKACEMITAFQAKTTELQKQSQANQELI